MKHEKTIVHLSYMRNSRPLTMSAFVSSIMKRWIGFGRRRTYVCEERSEMMAERNYPYVIIGAGLTGGYAIEGIREIDKNGPILLFGEERHLPYDRPDLTKKLWFGKKTLDQVYAHDRDYYEDNGVEVALNNRVMAIEPKEKTVLDRDGESYHYGKLLLATGGIPRSLPIPGSDLDGIYYYRYLDDYARLREEAGEGKSAVVIGGGFIGSEISAALNMQGVEVTMVFPESYLVNRVFPPYLGNAIQDHYRQKGVVVLAGDVPTGFEKSSGKFIITTRAGKRIESDILIVGVGIAPSTELAEDAGLQIENGIVVDRYLQTTAPDIYAAGDNASFPYEALGRRMRVEHWDNAVTGGKWAGRNMAGASEPYTHMPYFFSDLFEFGYEAVGDVDSRLKTYPDWRKENDTGVVYYMEDSKIRGMMMCNVWDKVEVARDMIRRGESVSPESLHGGRGLEEERYGTGG
jgi:3-phenylpropionate/trans-cinnamate dioxygenase ferredoxin reductase subunit